MRIWTLTSKDEAVKEVVVFTEHTRTVTAVDFSSKDSLCASLDAEGEMKVWRFETGECFKTVQLTTHGAKFNSFSHNPLRFHPKSPSLVAAAFASTVWLIDIEACPEGAIQGEHVSVRTLETPHSKQIGHLDWSSDGNLLLTCSEDTICVWDMPNGSLLNSQGSQTGRIASCCFVPNNLGVVMFGEYESIFLWNFAASSSKPVVAVTAAASNGMITALCCVAPQGEVVVCSGSSAKDDNLKLWRY